jgi:hypothetical protein
VYTIEVLILHTFGEWMSSQDGGTQVSLLLGVTIPLATTMGMHRNSRAYNGLTPFQGEMRRRVWAVVLQMDIVSPFELSLPATIHHDDSRCSLQRNIFNYGFNKNTKELPRPRALSKATEIAYNIITTRLTFELGKILHLRNPKTIPPVMIFPSASSH